MTFEESCIKFPRRNIRKSSNGRNIRTCRGNKWNYDKALSKKFTTNYNIFFKFQNKLYYFPLKLFKAFEKCYSVPFKHRLTTTFHKHTNNKICEVHLATQKRFL